MRSLDKILEEVNALYGTSGDQIKSRAKDDSTKKAKSEFVRLCFLEGYRRKDIAEFIGCRVQHISCLYRLVNPDTYSIYANYGGRYDSNFKGMPTKREKLDFELAFGRAI